MRGRGNQDVVECERSRSLPIDGTCANRLRERPLKRKRGRQALSAGNEDLISSTLQVSIDVKVHVGFIFVNKKQSLISAYLM